MDFGFVGDWCLFALVAYSHFTKSVVCFAEQLSAKYPIMHGFVP